LSFPLVENHLQLFVLPSHSLVKYLAGGGSGVAEAINGLEEGIGLMVSRDGVNFSGKAEALGDGRNVVGL
jgi:hypothetical protein